MKKYGLILAAFLMGLTAWTVQSAEDQPKVEEYTVSGSVQAALPGTETREGTTYDIEVMIGSLSFAGGTAKTARSSVELAGAESEFKAMSYTGEITVPKAERGGAVTARARIAGHDSGFSKTEPLLEVGTVTVEKLQLDRGLSATRLALRPGSSAHLELANVSGGAGCVADQVIADAGVVEPVEGARSSADLRLTEVDAATGLLSFSGKGTISLATEKPTPATRKAG